MAASARPTTDRAPDDAGFTLLELLVVITIMVLLAVAVGTVALNYLGRAKSDAAKLQFNQIEAGLDLFRLDIGRYPSSQEGVRALVEKPSGLPSWDGPYVRKKAAIVDPWGEDFRYEFPSRHGGEYDLYTLGADRAEGGEDEATDIVSWEE